MQFDLDLEEFELDEGNCMDSDDCIEELLDVVPEDLLAL
jgi:hypothetical protein